LKLLFDANLSPKLVRRLADLFPDLTHVLDAGLAQFMPDIVIWDYAGQNGFTIVTTDADFIELVEKRGPPPKVIRIEKCDFRTAEVENLLRRNAIRIAEFEQSDLALLVLRRQS
jgi:predicted nuclease of predicted toxin-antitoxin system